MRSALIAVALLCSCTPVDNLVGAFNVTVSGMDMQTAPGMSTSTVAGTGTLTVNANKEKTGYVISFGESNYQCVLTGTRNSAEPLQVDIPDMQTCHIANGNANATAVTTDAKLSLDKATGDTATLTVSYTWTYTNVFNFSGTGTRTYAGARQ
ncbi:MAG: hypothetical protein IPJ65_26125 [Archangiaceae bacterium]|nr:hypothetical protein [Archangiaceae bacterium]